MANGAGGARLTAVEVTTRDSRYLEAMEFHRPRVRDMIVATLAGRLTCCPAICGGRIQKMTDTDLMDEIGISDAKELTCKLFAAAIDRDAKAEAFVDAEALIAAYVEKTAGLMAKEEAQPCET